MSTPRHIDADAAPRGVLDTAVEAITLALRRGFRITVNCTLFAGEEPGWVAGFFEHVTEKRWQAGRRDRSPRSPPRTAINRGAKPRA